MTNDTLATRTEDAINPRHYKSHPSEIECIEISKHLSGCLAQAFQYVWRCGQKDDPIQELKKAIWFIDAELTVGRFYSPDWSVKDKLDEVLAYEQEPRRVLALRSLVCANEQSNFRVDRLIVAKKAIQELIVEHENTTD